MRSQTYHFYDFLKYIVDNFKIDIHRDNDQAFVNACNSENIKIIKLLATYDPCTDAINLGFKYIVGTNDINIMYYYVERFPQVNLEPYRNTKNLATRKFINYYLDNNSS